MALVSFYCRSTSGVLFLLSRYLFRDDRLGAVRQIGKSDFLFLVLEGDFPSRNLGKADHPIKKMITNGAGQFF